MIRYSLRKNIFNSLLYLLIVIPIIQGCGDKSSSGSGGGSSIPDGLAWHTLPSTPWSGSESLTAGRCSWFQIYPVNSYDFGSLTSISVSNSGSGSFYSDFSCSQIKNTFSISSGATSVSVYFKTPLVESAALTASAQSLSSTASGYFKIDDFKIDFGSFTPGVCTSSTFSATYSGIWTVTTTVAETVNITRTSGTGAFYSDPNCTLMVTSFTIPAGAISSVLYYKNAGSGNTVFNFSGLHVLGSRTKTFYF